MRSSETPPLLDLRSIASWRINGLSNSTRVVATIPALQRGLVWKPQQIELLWDSIFRGFPIGSLVACRHMANQERHEGETSTHHLLDGQQRSQAIALGYDVPDFSNPEKDPHPEVLWLDLAPTHITPDSTRQFLFRLTKRSHPWGYQAKDHCPTLHAHEIRSSMECLLTAGEAYKRPKAVQLRPYIANKPIPLGFLMRCANCTDEASFCERLVVELKAVAGGASLPWIAEAIDLLNDPNWRVVQLPVIWNALQRAEGARLILLEVPKELIGEDDSLGQEQMSNIEHLFQRLNTQGTALTAEELVYSMIKAYYPKVATTVDNISPLRMKPSRLVNVAVRAALTKPESDHLHNGYTVSRLRAIALSGSGEFDEIVTYLSPDGPLLADLKFLDEILIYQKGSNPNGLPASVVSAVVRSKPEIFLLLLSWVRNQKEAVNEVRLYLPGLLSLLSCYGWKRPEACLLQYTKGNLSLASIRQGLVKAIEDNQMARLQSPKSLREALPDFTVMESDEEFLNWHAWPYLIKKETDEATHQATEAWWYFSERLFCGNLRRSREIQEMLLYAQREFLELRFPGYDQANSQLWEDHDRPWDYDHILADEVSYNRRHSKAPYKKTIDLWINTLGNFWACPFEDNRSYGNIPLSEKSDLGGKDFLANAFIEGNEFDGFNGHYQTVSEPMAARKFAEAAKNRMLRIYSEWYYGAKINELLDFPTLQAPADKELIS